MAKETSCLVIGIYSMDNFLSWFISSQLSGAISSSRQSYEDAIVHYNKAIKKDPTFFEAYESKIEFQTPCMFDSFCCNLKAYCDAIC